MIKNIAPQKKEETRKKIRKIRKNLTKNDRKQKDVAIAQHLESLDAFKSAQTILFYVSNNEEVDTSALIQKYLKSKNIVIPVTEPSEQLLKLCHLEDWNDLEPGHYGILEIPDKKHIPANHDHIDLVIVPGIAFDQKGHRIGYGKGYYDTLLKKLDAKAVGLAYECQLIEKIPFEPHDIPVQTILTEKQILQIHS